MSAERIDSRNKRTFTKACLLPSFMSTPQTRTIYQNLVDSDAPPIKLYTLLESLLTEELIQELLSGAPSSPLPIPIRIGISPAYSSAGTLCAIALASETVALIIQFNNEANAQREMLSSQVFCNADCFLYAFDLGPLAAALYLDRKLRMLNGIDVQDACLPGEGSDRDPFAAIKFAVGEDEQLYKENIDSAFEDLTWDTSLPRCFNSVALRAWVARYLPNIADMEERFNGVKRVNTQDMDDEYVKLIAQFARGDQRLAAKKTNTTAHDFKTLFTNKQKAKLTADRFQDRFRKNSDMQLRVCDATGAEYLTRGGTAVVAGRSATIETADRLEGKTILGVTTLNAAKPTIVDRQKAYHSLRAFQGHVHLLTNPFLKYILQPSQEFSWPEEFISTDTIPPVLSD
ncbi:uncharacterized protein LAESUDRAFT_764322 [Laetiporus sulphureus 93-53]|uniref:Uncharacterized protein n=1 Tax=Laetiporus sulphureus 93-53 TaxID=1314785 RepID=A0A165BDB0_9APHY|nr:uncharacterized protein LAESUDRAFT_764322 [Laetiporus sulphureus 93-53]KZT00793.1 hypothetical protein LAESUDRAFT_764322 [Laetiporus sulphureus 93-53]